MKLVPTPSSLFTTNRNRLRERLPPKSLVVLLSNDVMPTNADGTLGYRQNSDLFYLSGVVQEETILLLFPDAHDEKNREILFVREPTEKVETWEGHKLTKDEAKALSGVERVKWTSEFRGLFHRLMCECEHVFLNTNEHVSAAGTVESREQRFAQETLRRYPLHDYHRLARLMHELRLVKQPEEIKLLREACRITRDGFLRVLDFVEPGVNEAEVEAEFAHEFLRQKASFAYQPIIGGGKGNCALHYIANDQPLKKGELLLLDVAAGYGQYAADMTRTIPIGGKFSRRQKQVYQALLRVFRAGLELHRPGTLLKEIRSRTEELIEAELLALGLISKADIKKQDPDEQAFKKFYMHGPGHPLGLDVHDVGLASTPLAPGWVLTYEPGIYIKEEGFGIRLENDILITETGHEDLMADIPIEAEEIEERMKR
jgi:Xaa-Pro aminopeptidase